MKLENEIDLDIEVEVLSKKKGLFVLAERGGMGLDTVILEIAKKLSPKNKILYISYKNHHSYIKKSIGEGYNNLIINTSLNFYHDFLHLELDLLVKETNCQFLIINDLETMMGESYKLGATCRDKFIDDLLEVIKSNFLGIILIAPVSKKVDERGGDMRPQYEDITWCKNLAEKASIIKALYRPRYYGITEDEDGISTENYQELITLKSD